MPEGTAAPAAPAAPSQSTPAKANGAAPANGAASSSSTPPAEAPRGGIAQAKAALDASRGKPAAKAPAEAPAPWGDEDESAFWAMAKRAPYFKVKAGGREVAIDSKEAWETHGKRNIERAQGLNTLVENAKKQMDEAKRMASETEGVRKLLDAARAGDEAAFRQLGIIHPSERAEQQKFLEELPPAMRAVVEENARLQREIQSKAEAEEAASQKAHQAKVLEEAKGHAGSIAQALVGEDGTLQPEMIYEAVKHMDVMHRAGAKLGRDYTAEDVRDFARERFEADGLRRTLAMAPDRLLPHVAPVLAGQPFEAFASAAGEEAAKAFAQQASRWLLRLARGGGQSQAPAPLTPTSVVAGQSTALPPQKPTTNGHQPLPALRFPGRR